MAKAPPKRRQQRLRCPLPSCGGRRFYAQGLAIHVRAYHRAAYQTDEAVWLTEVQRKLGQKPRPRDKRFPG